MTKKYPKYHFKVTFWPPPSQGFHKLWPHSVNWWQIGIGPFWFMWCPVRSQNYLDARRYLAYQRALEKGR